MGSPGGELSGPLWGLGAGGSGGGECVSPATVIAVLFLNFCDQRVGKILYAYLDSLVWISIMEASLSSSSLDGQSPSRLKLSICVYLWFLMIKGLAEPWDCQLRLTFPIGYKSRSSAPLFFAAHLLERLYDFLEQRSRSKDLTQLGYRNTTCRVGK
jgi:hypothetical protein